MTLLDRHILTRFMIDFVILAVILFMFAASIDVVLALDEFVAAAEASLGPDAGFVARAIEVVRLAVGFQAPRAFQFYGFLHGMLAIGAMGFTLARMHRHRELVAMLAAGISMHRIAMPFVVGMFVLSLGQLVNQEVFLPRVAPLLIRGHQEIGQRSVEAFPIAFTRDDRGSLLHAAEFDPAAGRLSQVTILERDQLGRTNRRLVADGATWREPSGEDAGGWMLEGGRAVRLAPGARDAMDLADAVNAGDAAAGRPVPGRVDDPDGIRMVREDVAFFETNLSPRSLVLRRHGGYASMLSMRQIDEILESRAMEDRESLRDSLRRYRHGRFAAVVVNVLLMWLALPTFLVRGPTNLLVRALICAAVTMPAVIGSAIFMFIRIEGIPPLLSVFVPALVLVWVVPAEWLGVKT